MNQKHGKKSCKNTSRFTHNNSQKIPNWKTPSDNGIQGFWFKKFTSLIDRLAIEMNRYLEGAHIPELIIKRKTTLIQKDSNKGKTHNVPTDAVKIITAKTREDIYYSFISCDCFSRNWQDAARQPEEQESYYILINTSSWTTKRDRKVQLWRGFTTKRHMIWICKSG